MKLRAAMAFMSLALASATALGGCSGKEEVPVDLVGGRGKVIAIAVLPAAWTDGKTSNSCELCPDAVVLKSVTGADARPAAINKTSDTPLKAIATPIAVS